MKRFICLSVACIMLANLACGQDGTNPGGNQVLVNDVVQVKIAKHPATPFLDSSSALLIDIDITKLDLNRTIQWLQTHFEPAKQTALPAEQLAMATGFIETLKSAGAKHLYVIAATRSVAEGGPVVVIPCQNTVTVQALANSMVQGMPEGKRFVVQTVEQAVVVGPEVAIDRMLDTPAVPRTDLVGPLLSADRSDHLLIASLPDDAREELAALWPDRLPNLAGKDHSAPDTGISPRALARDIRSIKVSLSLPPEPSVTVAIRCPATAVKRVNQAVQQLIAMSPPATRALQTSTGAETVTVAVLPVDLAKVFAEMIGPARQAADRQSAVQALRQIGLAMHNYHDVHKHFPPRMFTDPEGKPLLGWRVAILPYIEQVALYRAIKLDQAFDSKQNTQVAETVIATYQTGNEGSSHPTHTRIRVPVMKGSFWHGDGPPRSIRDIKDGTSNTIAAIIAPQAAQVHWMSPEPWVISVDDPIKDVFGDNDTITTLFFDGSVRHFTKAELDNKKLKALLTFAGGEVIE